MLDHTVNSHAVRVYSNTTDLSIQGKTPSGAPVVSSAIQRNTEHIPVAAGVMGGGVLGGGVSDTGSGDGESSTTWRERESLVLGFDSGPECPELVLEFGPGPGPGSETHLALRSCP